MVLLQSALDVLGIVTAYGLWRGIRWSVPLRSRRAASAALIIMTVLVAITYKLLPDTTVRWRDIWSGAGITAVLVVASQALVGLYLRSSAVESASSVAGAVRKFQAVVVTLR